MNAMSNRKVVNLGPGGFKPPEYKNKNDKYTFTGEQAGLRLATEHP